MHSHFISLRDKLANLSLVGAFAAGSLGLVSLASSGFLARCLFRFDSFFSTFISPVWFDGFSLLSVLVFFGLCQEL
ncbi:hypothetical protein BpHYR1_006430 [Brachionus plicatilis]|uniref:Uncharacterized protein n=1 Tax=Brachionus plicatilis TaxID=10195 RepID=A0A3M7SXK1_BRAPC|nr:hypothetical protein BpHYR1_006430 [Brachionus plicatilis]